MLTALIAGGFVLLLRRKRARAGQPRVATGLLLLFTGQNVLLVGSAVRRLGLYVAAYGLTEWRVAAFCWMGFVACGLALIAVQVASDRINEWLASRATLVAGAVLYGWCLADVPGMVASYDVAHCAEVTGSGPALDLGTLLDLGPPALTAIDAVRVRLHLPAVDEVRDEWARTVRRETNDWRTWRFRAWRLARRLDTIDTAGRARRTAGSVTTRRILVVDDDPNIRAVIAFAVERAGMACKVAGDGTEALAHFARDGFDLVVDRSCPRTPVGTGAGAI